MDTKLDLDIENYNIKDIEKFFRFPQNSSYTAIDVELRENEIREQLLKSGHINKRLKRDLITFLTLAKQWLINAKCVNTKTPPNDNSWEFWLVVFLYLHTLHLLTIV